MHWARTNVLLPPFCWRSSRICVEQFEVKTLLAQTLRHALAGPTCNRVTDDFFFFLNSQHLSLSGLGSWRRNDLLNPK